MDSWRAILQGVRPRAFRISVEDVRVAAGDASGFVTCVEVVETDDSKGRWVAARARALACMRMRGTRFAPLNLLFQGA